MYWKVAVRLGETASFCFSAIYRNPDTTMHSANFNAARKMMSSKCINPENHNHIIDNDDSDSTISAEYNPRLSWKQTFGVSCVSLFRYWMWRGSEIICSKETVIFDVLKKLKQLSYTYTCLKTKGGQPSIDTQHVIFTLFLPVHLLNKFSFVRTCAEYTFTLKVHLTNRGLPKWWNVKPVFSITKKGGSVAYIFFVLCLCYIRLNRTILSMKATYNKLFTKIDHHLARSLLLTTFSNKPASNEHRQWIFEAIIYIYIYIHNNDFHFFTIFCWCYWRRFERSRVGGVTFLIPVLLCHY